MTHGFKIVLANSTFGTLRENLNQGDYINRKKGIITGCKKVKLSTKKSFNTGRNIFPVNKTNLIVGQYSKLNLSDVCTASELFPYLKPSPCSLNAPCNPCQNNANVVLDLNQPFYNKYQIDPLGELFGKTQCGELNYTRYMSFYPPTK